MKKTLLFFFVSLLGTFGLYAQCDTASIITSGLPWSPVPVAENLSAAEVGVVYSDDIAAHLPDTLELDPGALLGIPLPIPLPPFAFPMESQVMSPGEMPPGLSATFSPGGSLSKGESACINISGTPTTDTVTSVTINVIYTVRITSEFTDLFAPIPSPIDTGLYTIPIPVPYTWDMDITASVADDLNADQFQIAQNVPNPAKDMTVISFTSPVPTSIGVEVHDMLGNVVSQTSTHANAGLNAFELSTANLTPGIYFYSLDNGATVLTKRMVIMK